MRVHQPSPNAHRARPPAPLPPCNATTHAQSGTYPLEPGVQYRFCIYVAVCSCGASASTSIPTAITMVDSVTYLPYGTPLELTITGEWQQLCFIAPPISSPGNYYFTLRLGAAVETFCIDDATIEYIAEPCGTFPPP